MAICIFAAILKWISSSQRSTTNRGRRTAWLNTTNDTQGVAPPPSSEPDYSFLIRTADQLSHVSALCCRVRKEFSPRFNIYPALLYLYQEFLHRVEG